VCKNLILLILQLFVALPDAKPQYEYNTFFPALQIFGTNSCPGDYALFSKVSKRSSNSAVEIIVSKPFFFKPFPNFLSPLQSFVFRCKASARKGASSVSISATSSITF
jgi:hypothetical protein